MSVSRWVQHSLYWQQWSDKYIFST
jgi:hypothetical protein